MLEASTALPQLHWKVLQLVQKLDVIEHSDRATQMPEIEISGTVACCFATDFKSKLNWQLNFLRG